MDDAVWTVSRKSRSFGAVFVGDSAHRSFPTVTSRSRPTCGGDGAVPRAGLEHHVLVIAGKHEVGACGWLWAGDTVSCVGRVRSAIDEIAEAEDAIKLPHTEFGEGVRQFELEAHRAKVSRRTSGTGAGGRPTVPPANPALAAGREERKAATIMRPLVSLRLQRYCGVDCS